MKRLYKSFNSTAVTRASYTDVISFYARRIVMQMFVEFIDFRRQEHSGNQTLDEVSGERSGHYGADYTYWGRLEILQ